MNTPTVEQALQARDEAMESVARNAGSEFRANALSFVERFLTEHGPSSGEDITDACKAAGVIPHDDRAFGPIYMKLMRSGAIEKCGAHQRKKGHGTSGGNIWKLTGVASTPHPYDVLKGHD